ncbi:hypothetical protein HOY80DRAFT_583227 [Tuber brumale]|nr:hypothetical protein HOY80DRAFT_583227 [Tuber brumale]
MDNIGRGSVDFVWPVPCASLFADPPYLDRWGNAKLFLFLYYYFFLLLLYPFWRNLCLLMKGFVFLRWNTSPLAFGILGVHHTVYNYFICQSRQSLRSSPIFLFTQNLDYFPSTVRVPLELDKICSYFSSYSLSHHFCTLIFFASLILCCCHSCLFLLNYSSVLTAYDTFQCSHDGTYPPCLALFPILFL